jgi:hypothetical protein
MRQIIITLSLLVSLSLASAAFVGLPEEVASKLPAIKANPLASSILLWANESYELTDDGKQIYEWHSFRYLPDDMARDAWGDPHVAYIEGRENLEILASRAYTPDGRQVESTPWNAYNPITPEALQFAPDLTQFRQMVVTHLGLENGCIVEFQYRITRSNPVLPWFEGRVELREEAPTIYRTLNVKVPKDINLTCKSLNGAPEAVANGSSLTWTVQNVPGYHPDDLAGHRELLPQVVFSSAKDWPAIQSEFLRRVTDAQDAPLTLPKSLEEAIWKAPDPRSKLDSIRTWISERFASYHFAHSEFAVSMRNTANVLNTGYGNQLELATLVSQILNTNGIQNTVVLKSKGNVPVPALVDFEQALLSVDLKDQIVLCDPMQPSGELLKNYLADYTLTYLDGKPKYAEEDRFSSDLFMMTIVLNELNADTLTGTGTLEALGSVSLRNVIEGLIDWEGFACTQATVRELTVDKTAVSFEFTAPALEDLDDYRVLPLSLIDFGMSAPTAPMKLPERQFSQLLFGPTGLKLEIRGMIPDEWELVHMPEAVSLASEFGKANVIMDVKKGQKRFEFTRSMLITTDRIAPSDWPTYRKWVFASYPQDSNEILFKAPKKEE